MGGETIKTALAGAVEYLTAHPVEARYRDGVARATLRAGLVVDVVGPNGEATVTDMVASVGGTDRAPSPGWLFRASAASCVATLIAMRAAMLEVALEALEVSVESESDDLGILGIDPSVPAGPLSMRVAVSVRAAGSEGTAPGDRDVGCRALSGHRCGAARRTRGGRARGLTSRDPISAARHAPASPAT